MTRIRKNEMKYQGLPDNVQAKTVEYLRPGDQVAYTTPRGHLVYATIIDVLQTGDTVHVTYSMPYEPMLFGAWTLDQYTQGSGRFTAEVPRKVICRVIERESV